MPQQILWFVTIFSLMHCIGCLNVIDKILDSDDEPTNGDSDNDSWIITDMPVRKVSVLIAESQPVQVTVEVIGYLPDGLPHAMRRINQGKETLSRFIWQPNVRKIGFVRRLWQTFVSGFISGLLRPAITLLSLTVWKRNSALTSPTPSQLHWSSLKQCPI